LETLLETFLRESTTAESVAIIPLVQRTAIVLITTQLLAWHYIRFANVLSNKRKFAHVLVGLSVTTFLVITVVKTSLALSLGLVGALSIIRFRTPIKEAEELVYLFVAIAIGLGIGAEKVYATLTVVGLLMLYGAAMAHRGIAGRLSRSMLHVHVPASVAGERDGRELLGVLLAALKPHAQNVNLRRVDTHEGEFNLSLVADTRSVEDVGILLEKVQGALPGATVSIIDREILE
jgi:hypothetical protein